jgi:hypothetical protein
MMDYDLKDSMKESQRRKRVAEEMDKLIKERNIRMEEVDSTKWHQLIIEAEKLANERI